MSERKCRTCEGTGSMRLSTRSMKPCTECGGLGVLNPNKVAVCYTINSTTGELIKIKEGVLGFIQVPDKITHLPVKGSQAVELRDQLNESLGIAHEEELQLKGGSMFGWHLPLVRRNLLNVNRIPNGTV